jgi:hypothetical protein
MKIERVSNDCFLVQVVWHFYLNFMILHSILSEKLYFYIFFHIKPNQTENYGYCNISIANISNKLFLAHDELSNKLSQLKKT